MLHSTFDTGGAVGGGRGKKGASGVHLGLDCARMLARVFSVSRWGVATASWVPKGICKAGVWAVSTEREFHEPGPFDSGASQI